MMKEQVKAYRPISWPQKGVSGETGKWRSHRPVVDLSLIHIWITPWPKGDQYKYVSCKARPVTQVAEVAVNNASRKGAACPLFVAKGSIRRNVPPKMRRRKPPKIILVGVNFPHCRCVIILISYLIRVLER